VFVGKQPGPRLRSAGDHHQDQHDEEQDHHGPQPGLLDRLRGGPARSAARPSWSGVTMSKTGHDHASLKLWWARPVCQGRHAARMGHADIE
jgi:hypothetical protein